MLMALVSASTAASEAGAHWRQDMAHNHMSCKQGHKPMLMALVSASAAASKGRDNEIDVHDGKFSRTQA